jgi:hypothetical protein
MLTNTEQHERLLYGLTTANASLAAGQHHAGRAAMLATLAEVGLVLDGPLPADDETALTAVVMAVSMEDGVSVYVLPDAALTPALRGALERCDRVTIDHSTEADAPDLFAAYQALGLATESAAWRYARDPHDGRLQAAHFAGRFSRVFFVHEWL